MKDRRPLQLQIWKQALDRLSEVLTKQANDRIVIDAAIQRFEFCFELGWKTIKAFLEFQGQKLALPRELIAAAYRVQWISDEPAWLQMMDDRNLSSQPITNRWRTLSTQDCRSINSACWNSPLSWTGNFLIHWRCSESQRWHENSDQRQDFRAGH